MDKRKRYSLAAGCMLLAGLGACVGGADSGGASSSASALGATCSDTRPPVLTSHTLNLWPPNHKFHDVAVSDCVSAVNGCNGALLGDFIWASSDEPIDSIGDGHFGPDIGLGVDTHHACVRSERQGPKDGRVYKLGVRVTDAAGNSVEGECLVIVDHDQRGVTGKESAEAYRLQFDPAQAGVDCNGNPGQPDAGTGSGGTGSGTGGATGSGGSTAGSGGSTAGSGGSTAGSGGGEHIL